MGQIADDIVNGDCCEVCMTYFIRAHGYPVLCRHCKKQDPKSRTPIAFHPEMGSAQAHKVGS